MKYKYALVDEAGKCFEVRESTYEVKNSLYVPMSGLDASRLGMYYYPLPRYVDTVEDFVGTWYDGIPSGVKC